MLNNLEQPTGTDTRLRNAVALLLALEIERQTGRFPAQPPWWQ
jgi:hypothetical protein